MGPPFSLQRRNFYPWLFLALAATAVAIAHAFGTRLSHEVLISLVGAVAALVHFLYSQHNHNTERFIALFREFNARYDALNSGLNELLKRDGSLLLSGKDEQLLFDYFNLCAEEYLYFKSGYIDPEVWKSWVQGMRFFARNAEIRRLWKKELAAGSYYGFSATLLEDAT
jgi:hypothetical protein